MQAANIIFDGDDVSLSFLYDFMQYHIIKFQDEVACYLSLSS